jgi:hypothetical protein
MSVLDDILSKDPHRIWSASGAIRHLRDRHELAVLVAHLDDIKQKTQGVPLGGALRPNSSHLDFAIRKLEFLKHSSGCMCELYPMDDLYNPGDEAKAGHVVIEATVLDDAKWVDYYVCRCAFCDRRYRVEEREYHYWWWKWSLMLDDANR